MMHRCRIALAIGLIAPSFAAADLADTTIILDPVVVTATRTELARRSVPASVTVLSQEQLVSTGATDALSAVAAATPGVFITQNDVAGFGLGPGSAGSISIRGVGGGTPNDQVLLLVDGQPQYAGLFGHPLPDAYALGEVERVEILRSPSSALYGGGAMGGVINIVTQRATTPGDRFTISSQAGPWSTYDGSVGASGSHGAIDYRLTAAYTTTDGHRDSSEFSRSHLSGLLGYRSGPWNVRLSASTTPFDGYDPGPEYSLSTSHIDVTRNSSALNATYEGRRTTTSSAVYYNWGYHDFSSGWDSFDYVRGVNVHTDYHLGSNGASINVGVEGRQYGGNAEDHSSDTDYGDMNVNEVAASLGAIVPIGSRARIISAGRAQWHEEFGWLFAPEAGATYDVTSKLTVRAAASRGYRDPSIRELYLFTPSNTDVKPETVTNIETGVIWRVIPSVVAEASLFRLTGDDIVVTHAPPPAFENAGSFTNYGTELEVRWAARRVHGSVFASWQHVGDLEDGSTSTIVTGSPERTLGMNVTVLVEKVRVNTSLQWVSDFYGDDGDDADSLPDALDDYAVVNLSASRPVYGPLTARIALRNVLDEEYSTITGYPMPGRHVLVGLSATLER